VGYNGTFLAVLGRTANQNDFSSGDWQKVLKPFLPNDYITPNVKSHQPEF
jgi:hypothetical protein